MMKCTHHSLAKAVSIFLSVLLLVSFWGLALQEGIGASYNQWQPYTNYQVNERVTYDNKAFECRQAHYSLPGWEPPNVLALWLPLEGDQLPPSIPTGLTAISVSSTQITVTWNGSAGATSYDLEVDGAVVQNANSPYLHTGLNPSSTHNYRVRARNSSGASAWSAVVSTVTPPSDLPAVPANLRATPVSTSQIQVNWDSVTGATAYDLEVNGVIKTNVTSPYADTGLAAGSTHTYKVRAKNSLGTSAWSVPVSATTSLTPPQPIGAKLVIGYWHNFDNGSGLIKLRNVSPKYDVINVAFAEPSGAVGNIGFTPYQHTAAEFKADVAYLKGQGKKVIISIGGQNGQVQLTTAAARQNFVTSMISIIENYGFDGMDIDFEGHSLYLNAGDTDFKNPTTPVVTNLIAAVREIRNHFGSSFILTMAPETFFVQVGYTNYAGLGSGDNRAGAYLPVIYALRDLLNWLQVQHYNSGPVMGLDDQWHFMGNADFHVAMADMVLQGFPIARNPNNFFPALRPDQVVIGIPACNYAGNGYTAPAEMKKAFDYLIKGVSFGGSYRLRNPMGYSGLRGVMTWSINWDAYTGNEFSNFYRSYFDALP